MKLFNFGRKVEPSTAPATPAEEIERVEGEIQRLRREAAAARQESEAVALTDPARSVELHGNAQAADLLVQRMASALPGLYRARREAALAARDAEISALIQRDGAHAQKLAGQIRSLAVEISAKVNALHALNLGMPNVFGALPPGLSGQRVHEILLSAKRGQYGAVQDLNPDAITAEIDSDLRGYLVDLESIGLLLKQGEREGPEVWVNNVNQTLAIRCRQLVSGLQPFRAPPAEPEPEPVETPTAAAVV